MALQKTASGKVDKRTTEYKKLVANAKKARAAQNKGAKLKKTASGKVDKRTKEGKEVAARMAKARKAKGSLKNKLKRLFK